MGAWIVNKFTERIDTLYGVVRMYVPAHKTRKKKNMRATIKLYLPAPKPGLLRGLTTCLAYESDICYYEIYNPNRLDFELDKLISDIKLIHRYSFTEIVGNFRVMDFSNNALGV